MARKKGLAKKRIFPKKTAKDWKPFHYEVLKKAQEEFKGNKWKEIQVSGKYPDLSGFHPDQLRYRMKVIPDEIALAKDIQEKGNAKHTPKKKTEYRQKLVEGEINATYDGENAPEKGNAKETSQRILDAARKNNELMKKVSVKVKFIANLLNEKKDKYVEQVADPRPGPQIKGHIKYRTFYLPQKIIEMFHELASENTRNNIETCGFLAGTHGDNYIRITTLIIPKQFGTSVNCEAVDENEQVYIQDTYNVATLGWIHTHPSHVCFMSSIDLHSQFGYQSQIPEAVAVVLAPKDPQRKVGIFQLTVPTGMTLIKNCELSGFHDHPNPSDGSLIYQECSHVIMTEEDIQAIDLRSL